MRNFSCLLNRLAPSSKLGLARLRARNSKSVASAALLAAWAAVGGCVDDNQSVYIVGVAIPTASDSSCSFEGETTLLNGTYDPSRGNSYIVYPRVINALLPRANEIRPESNGVYIELAVVSIVSTNAPDVTIAEYSVPAHGFIPPGGSSGVVAVEAIPAGVGTTADSGQLILNIRLVGRTQGDIDIETGDFTWPVSLCNGCLFTPCDPAVGNDEPGLGACSPGSNFATADLCTAGM